MVLEGATATDTFTDAPPSSDTDPYSTTSPSDLPSPPTGRSAHQTYNVDAAKLPQPFKLFGLIGPSLTTQHFELIKHQCDFASQMLNRDLSQPEVDAFAYHTAKSVRVASYGAPVGISLGAIQAWRTQGTMKFPFYQPKNIDPNVFGPLRGQFARSAWTVTRAQAYWFVGWVLGELFFASYAVSVGSAGKAMDGRLKEFNEALRRRIAEGKPLGEIAGARPPPGQRGSVTTPEGRMDEMVNRLPRENFEGERIRPGVAPRGQRQREREVDDASPTGGAFLDDHGDAGTDTGLLSDEQMQRRDRKQQSDAGGQAENRANTFAMEKVTSQPKNFDSDDASPAAQTEKPAKEYPKGSTWERIRREAATGRSEKSGSAWSRAGSDSGVKKEQRDGSTLGDSFSFSETEEERQLAKTEAQKDFDARLDRERAGGDFNEERRGRRW